MQCKTAFVLAHKLREAMAAEQTEMELSGEVEVDDAYFGGHVRPENRKEDRRDRWKKEHQTGKRRVVVALRERDGRTLPFVFRSEDQAIPTIRARVANGTTVYADEASSWDDLHASYPMPRVNQPIAFVDDGACTNQIERFFARLRRAEWGQHHHISGRYLHAYAGEVAWREDYRQVSNGGLFTLTAAAALAHPVSRQWKGYWQRQRMFNFFLDSTHVNRFYISTRYIRIGAQATQV